MLDISPYFVGLWLGDGFLSLNMGKYWKFGIVCSEFNYDEIYSIVKPTRVKEYQMKNGKYKYFELFTGDKELTGYLLENCGSNARDKHLPGNVSREQFWELLSGLIDSDGTVDSKSYSMSLLNSNKRIIDDVCSKLDEYDIGYSVSVRKSRKDIWADIYVVRFQNSDLCKMNLNLRVGYKKEAFEFLKEHSKRFIEITDEQFQKNKEYLKSVLSRSTFYFFDTGKRKKRVTEEIYKHMIV